MLENLFKFPVVMVDGHKEEEKEREIQRLALDNQPHEVDMIIGEAECPYFDFISVTDRWLPTEESFQKVLQGVFDACSVVFSHSGNYVVPWPKEKFKKELSKFAKKMTKDEPTKLMDIDKNDLIRMLKRDLDEGDN